MLPAEKAGAEAAVDSSRFIERIIVIGSDTIDRLLTIPL